MHLPGHRAFGLCIKADFMCLRGRRLGRLSVSVWSLLFSPAWVLRSCFFACLVVIARCWTLWMTGWEAGAVLCWRVLVLVPAGGSSGLMCLVLHSGVSAPGPSGTPLHALPSLSRFGLRLLLLGVSFPPRERPFDVSAGWTG